MGLKREQMIQRVREAGVVGAGGAGFPTHVKYDANVDLVIANGAECEPLIRVDQQLMATKAAEVIRGLCIAMECTGAARGVIGLKAKYHPAIEALEQHIHQKRLGDSIGLHLLDNYYPAGDEFVLVREVTGKAIPEFGLPLHVGAVVSNVATLVDVAAAVDAQQPVIERLVTVAGAVARPATFSVPVGTAYETLLAAAGGPTVDRPHFVAGGPMMGALVEIDQTVKKTSSALLVLPFESPVIRRRLRSVARQLQLTRAACLKCMMCTEVCPRNLLGHRLVPDRLMRNLAAGVTEDLAAFQGSYLCSECGLCAVYGCVMNLDPCAVNREMKLKLGAAGVPRPEPLDSAQARIYEPLRRVPTIRLTARLGLSRYDGPAPLTPFTETVQRVQIALAQHLGAPAEAQVVVGQQVRAGDLLGEIPSGKLGARVHASVAGTVLSVTSEAVTIELG